MVVNTTILLFDFHKEHFDLPFKYV